MVLKHGNSLIAFFFFFFNGDGLIALKHRNELIALRLGS